MHRWIPILLLILVAGSPAPPVGAADHASNDARRQALVQALDDERRSEAFYRAVVERHGAIQPFVNIASAESRHAAHLLSLFESYGVEIPDDRWADEEFEVPDTVRAACLQGIESETANVALYDELLEHVADTDIRDQFLHLRNMSLEHHLLAFQQCSMRSAGGRAGRAGAGRGCCGGCGGGRGTPPAKDDANAP